jgi:hypothetical protein
LLGTKSPSTTFVLQQEYEVRTTIVTGNERELTAHGDKGPHQYDQQAATPAEVGRLIRTHLVAGGRDSAAPPGREGADEQHWHCALRGARQHRLNLRYHKGKEFREEPRRLPHGSRICWQQLSHPEGWLCPSPSSNIVRCRAQRTVPLLSR